MIYFILTTGKSKTIIKDYKMSKKIIMQEAVDTQLDKKPNTVVDPKKAEIMAYAENPSRLSAISRREIVDTLGKDAELNPTITFNNEYSLARYFIYLGSSSEDNPFKDWNTEYAAALANMIFNDLHTKISVGDNAELTLTDVIDVINYFETDAESLDIEANKEGERASAAFDSLQKRMGEIAASREERYTRTS